MKDLIIKNPKMLERFGMPQKGVDLIYIAIQENPNKGLTINQLREIFDITNLMGNTKRAAKAALDNLEGIFIEEKVFIEEEIISKCGNCTKVLVNDDKKGSDDKIYCPICYNKLQEENKELRDKIKTQEEIIADLNIDKE